MSPSGKTLTGLLLALGVCAIATWGCATPGEPRPPGTLVQGKSRLYTLTIHGTGWKQVPSAAIEGPDLALAGHNLLGQVVVHLHAGTTIDAVEDQRRGLIKESSQPRLVETRRSFLHGSDLIPASLARYRVGSNWMNSYYFAVFTVRTDNRVIEVVGMTGAVDEPQREREVDRLVKSLQMLGAPASSGTGRSAP